MDVTTYEQTVHFKFCINNQVSSLSRLQSFFSWGLGLLSPLPYCGWRFDCCGLDRWGFDRWGFDRWGFDRWGLELSFDRWAFDPDSFD